MGNCFDYTGGGGGVCSSSGVCGSGGGVCGSGGSSGPQCSEVQ